MPQLHPLRGESMLSKYRDAIQIRGERKLENVPDSASPWNWSRNTWISQHPNLLGHTYAK